MSTVMTCYRVALTKSQMMRSEEFLKNAIPNARILPHQRRIHVTQENHV